MNGRAAGLVTVTFHRTQRIIDANALLLAEIVRRQDDRGGVEN